MPTKEVMTLERIRTLATAIVNEIVDPGYAYDAKIRMVESNLSEMLRIGREEPSKPTDDLAKKMEMEAQHFREMGLPSMDTLADDLESAAQALRSLIPKIWMYNILNCGYDRNCLLCGMKDREACLSLGIDPSEYARGINQREELYGNKQADTQPPVAG